jgi:UDP-N-acetylglucosamine transferase subunit ALG13
LIFVTVGTHHHPFQRLLDGLAALDPAELVVQHGPGRPPPGVARAEAFMPFDEVLACLDEAEKVITHAGVGSILCARRAGHTPLVVPRRSDLGEHVDEHQAGLCAALEERGAVIAVRDVGRLPELLARATVRGPAGAGQAAGELSAAVRGALGAA